MLFTNKRSEVEIIYDLLSSAQKDIKKTHLMYKANMAHAQFTKYLDALIEKGLLSEKVSNPEGKIYYITDEGKKLLEPLRIVLARLK